MAEGANDPSRDTLRQVIEQHRNFLEERIDPDYGLLSKLLESRTLSRREYNEIKANSLFYGRNSKLLDFILKKDEGERLVTALRDADQIHVANYLIANAEYKSEFGGDWPLTEKEVSLLDTNQKILLDLLELSDLLGLLYSSKVVNKWQMDSISSKPTSHEKNEALIDILQRRSLRDYWQTIICLHQSEQSHIAEILEKGGAVLRIHANMEGKNAIEAEKEILTALATIFIDKLSNRTIEESDLIMELLRRTVIAAKAGQSIVLYIYCKTIEELQQLHESLTTGRLKASVELWFNRLLTRSQKISVATLTISTEEFQKMQTYFKDLAAEVQPVKTTINELPLELLDIVLQKFYLLYALNKQQSTEKRNEFLLNRLLSVDICWFQRLVKKRFKKTIWRHLSEFYEKRRRRIVIFRSNLSYLEENIEPKGLTSRLRSADCLPDVETRLLCRQTLHQSTKKLFRRNNNPDLLHVMRSFDDAKHSDFIRCLRKSKQKLIARVAENGGVSLKATISIPVTTKRLEQRFNDFGDKTKRRSHQMEKLISQLKDDDIEILNCLPDRQTVVWIWCQSQTGLEKIQKLNESSSLIDEFGGLIFPSSSPEINKTTSVSICREQFKKSCVVCLFIVNLTKRLKIGACEQVTGVTKLRNEIYVLCYTSVLLVFEDRNPFRLQKEIEIKEIKYPWDIGSSEKGNCLYITNIVQNCVWRITRGTEDKHKIIKWLTTDYAPHTLSMSSDGRLLVCGRYSSILRIYGSDAELLRSVELTRDIKVPLCTVETSIGNFIVLHYLKEEKEEKEERKEDELGIWEVSKDGQKVIRCFIPSDETQKLNDSRFLSLDSEDRVFVADCGNKRVILLDSDLKWNRSLCPKREGHKENKPYRLCYDEEKKQLVVGFYFEEVYIYSLNRK